MGNGKVCTVSPTRARDLTDHLIRSGQDTQLAPPTAVADHGVFAVFCKYCERLWGYGLCCEISEGLLRGFWART